MLEPTSLRPYLPIVIVAHAGIFVVLINATIADVTLPDIGDDLGVGSDTLPWVITSYIIAFAIGVTIQGRLADLFDFKKGYLVSIAGFALMSLAVGLAPNFPLLILFRVLQGFFAAGIMMHCSPSIVHTVPPPLRTWAFGIQNASVGIGLGLGPLAGAIGIDLFTWRAPFIGTAIFASLYLVAALRLLPFIPGAATGQRFDVIGSVLMSAAVGTTFVAVAEVPRDPTALVGLLSLTLAGPLWAAFLWWIRRVDQPFVPPVLLRNVHFLAIAGIAAGTGGIVIGGIFLVSLLLTDLFESSAIAVGLYLMPGALVMSLMSIIGGRLAGGFGDRFIIVSGSAAILVAATVLTLVGASWDIWAIASMYTVLAAGYAVIWASLPHVLAWHLPPGHVATGFGVFGFGFFFGGAIAVALETLILDWREGVTDAVTPFYSGPAAAHADSMLVVLIMAVATLYLALRYVQTRKIEVSARDRNIPSAASEIPPPLA